MPGCHPHTWVPPHRGNGRGLGPNPLEDPIVKNRTVLVAVAAALTATITLPACSSGDAVVTVNQGICKDLDSGATPFQIWRSLNEYGYTAEKFAHKLSDATLVVCPKHRSDADVQSLLTSWDLT